MLLSSHCSEATDSNTPSPQLGTHTETPIELVDHENKFSFVHVDEQPSLSFVFPSSQVSGDSVVKVT